MDLDGLGEYTGEVYDYFKLFNYSGMIASGTSNDITMEKYLYVVELKSTVCVCSLMLMFYTFFIIGEGCSTHVMTLLRAFVLQT